LQVRRSQLGSQNIEERLVDVLIRFEGRILSCGDSSRLFSLPGDSLEKPVVQVQSPAIRSESFSLGLHKGGETASQVLAKEGIPCDSLLGRFPGNGINKGGTVGSSRNSSTGSCKTWLAQRGIERNLGSNSITGILGIDNQHKGRSSADSRIQDSKDETEDFGGFEGKEVDSKSYCISGRNSDQRVKGILSSQTIHKDSLSSVEVISKEEMGMGGNREAFNRNMSRPSVDSGQCGSLQWSQCLETFYDSDNVHRCFTNRMGIQDGGNLRRRQLDSSGIKVPHQQVGVVGNAVFPKIYGGKAARKECSDSDRQHDSQKQLEQSRGIKFGLDRSSEGDMEVVNSERFISVGSRMDSRFNQHDCRSRKQSDRFSRLGIAGSHIPDVGTEVGSPFSGQNGISSQFETSKIQLPSLVPKDTRSQLFHSELDSREQLRSSSFRSDPQSAKSRGRMWISGNIGGSSMASATLVANTDVNGGGFTRAGFPFESDFHSRTIRNRGTFQESIMDLSGSQNLRKG